ncbi:NIF3-like protein 1 [Eublepharis macularius]|uniref:NIF3-like protein 1 n=1 Tax=Eublepharis macularius TaxID=481883 RepID=A0AA97IV79_EUBMA|nr:NIF3-like protein 1 [Eublepharis macularius]XP_054826209.1 NIF3-like protein 1 [Eublepharis macularius]XP_054826210.1 NIF3-like protein 1 [Eublepharis macularius]XP_054826211.1 NIF3-like protein 1 [Eublepharis macularius]XP_054826212.1 NIF3-like protein 1 [Eublepharis macularius]
MTLSCLKRIPRSLLRVRPLAGFRSQPFMDLKVLVSLLNDFASLSLAESWDNVGLLVEPSPPHVVNTLFLTNDLTEEVMEEALQKRADLILSYHPPIFKPLKRITWQTWKERLVIRALENRVAIYSPHTAYDAAPHGVNTWLAKGFGECTTVPLQPSAASNYPTKESYQVKFSSCSAENLETVLSTLHKMPGVSLIATAPTRFGGEEQTGVSLSCTQHALLQAVALLSQNPALYETTEIIPFQKPPLEHTGMGRLCTLKESVAASVLVERVKSHLRLPHVRLALGAGKSLESQVKVVAVCAGSGTSVLQGTEADLYLTGEMSHHDVLDAVAKGITVILCEHSNSERGFLWELQRLLATHLENKIHIIVSERDRDPLQVA